MSIKRIQVKNFKSFNDLNLELGNFNILIGANASGKSNFIQIFKFLRDIVKSGLDDAISLQGGVEYLKNLNIGTTNNLYVQMVSNEKYGRLIKRIKKGFIAIETYNTIYEFALKLGEYEYEIVEDKLVQECNFVRFIEINGGAKGKEIPGKISISCTNGKRNIIVDKPKEITFKINDIFPQYLLEEEMPSNSLLIETPFFMTPMNDINGISIYDFDPKLPKKATPITGRAELEEDGNNLSIVLKNIITDNDKKGKFTNLMKELLPFVSDLDVEKFAAKSLFFKLREIYSEKHYLPASLISDGTINITALIIALYFENKPITIIEEPERNIHPYLISKIMAMMKDASENKQIIVTTHNPEIIKHAEKEDILLVSRNKEGFTNIIRPSEKEEIKVFLENDMRIEELYVQNLLEI